MEADDVVDDGCRHVAVGRTRRPTATEFEVRGEDDAPPFVGVGDDLEQESGPVVGARAGSLIYR